jgi:hypothetical protein
VKPIEVNLSGFSAEGTLEQVSTKKAPAEALVLIPLMKNGNEDAIMQEWLRLTTDQGNAERSGILAAVVVFARLVGQFEKRSLLLKGFSMIVDPLVAQWIGQGHREGLLLGQTQSLLQLLGRKAKVPEELETKIRECNDESKLIAWFDRSAMHSLDEFRKLAQL